MGFALDETSIEDSLPREFYTISYGSGATVYRVASGDRDVLFAGYTWSATPSARLDLQLQTLTAKVELVLVLPTNHAIVQRYMAMGCVPPRQILVTAYRMQMRSAEVQQFHTGVVTGVSFDFKNHQAKFLIPSRTAFSLDRTLPSVLFDTTCGNILYDNWCAAARATYTRNLTAVVVNGQTITVDASFTEADQWAQFGELLHVPSGERMTITSQVGRLVKMQFPIPELKSGDAVQVFAGCDHTVNTCQTKFSNKDNYAGAPQRPTKDIFLPSGLGVLEQG